MRGGVLGVDLLDGAVACKWSAVDGEVESWSRDVSTSMWALSGRFFDGKIGKCLLHWLDGEWKSVVRTAEVRGCGAEDLGGKADQKEKNCEEIHGETSFCVCWKSTCWWKILEKVSGR